MSGIEFFNPAAGPKPVGPYSMIARAGGFYFFSGQIAINPESGQLEGKTTSEQMKVILENIEKLLKEINCTKENVVRTTIYIKNISDFQEVNSIYEEFFKDHKPARTTIEVSNLPKGALIELELICYKD